MTSGRSGEFGETESGVVLEEEEMSSVGRDTGGARMVGNGASMKPLRRSEERRVGKECRN